jgi:membrane fusion protein (multidrug efflux system)
MDVIPAAYEMSIDISYYEHNTSASADTARIARRPPMSSDFVVNAPTAPARLRRPSRRALLALGGGLALAAAAGFGWHYVTIGRFIESTDDAYVGGDVTAIAPKVSGVIAQVAVTDNQAVRAGDLLVRLDARDFAAALAKADAAVAQAQAGLAAQDAAAAAQRDMVAQARAALGADAAALTLARDNAARYAHLAATQAGSRQDAQSAEAAQAEAQAAQARDAAALAAASAQLDVIATQKQAQAAALAGALADDQEARLTLSYAQIRAPFDGVVGDRAAEAGGYATLGTPLLSLVPAHGLWVDANFKEDQLARIRPGDPVTIQADALPGVAITGHVAALAPATGAIFSILPAENATGNFTKIVQRVPVRILLDGAAGDLGALRPGLSVIASVDTK